MKEINTNIYLTVCNEGTCFNASNKYPFAICNGKKLSESEEPESVPPNLAKTDQTYYLVGWVADKRKHDATLYSKPIQIDQSGRHTKRHLSINYPTSESHRAHNNIRDHVNLRSGRSLAAKRLERTYDMYRKNRI